jgi:hypothetical protein
MSFYFPPWQNDLEPNQGNVRQWLDNLYSKFQPIEQARWNQSNVDTLFYAGSQSFVNRYFNFSPTSNQQQYYFNLVQQPINMITGYERQHRKQFMYQASEGGDNQTTDQYTKLIVNCCNRSAIHEQKSKAKELAAVSGMVLVQPYLDFFGDDAAQGSLKIKIWEYNSFLVDPYFRNPDMSDANFVWCQEYISKHEAEDRFPDKKNLIVPMAGSPQRYGSFYFLPENYNMARNDLLVLSYVWYKWKKKKKRLYSRSRKQFFDFSNSGEIDQILYNIPDMEEVEVEVPCWKLAVVLNDQLMFQGDNPLGFDSCPFVPYFWNYEPHINYYDLRVRSLVRPMRDPQFLTNYKIITNNDIAAATINAGWKRKVGAVANEDNLKKAGQGWDVIINEGYEMTDVEKIIPSAVPESDLALAEQMKELIFATSGINMENWSGQNDKQISSLTMMMKQAANLMVFQKYFDQWDFSDKLLGDLLLQIALHNWNAEKVKFIINEEPSPFFYSGIFSKYQTIVEEADLTPTQQNLQAQQMLDINTTFGREVFPPSMIIPKLNITGKGEIIPYLQQQEQQASQMEQEQQLLAQTFEEAKLKELYSKAAANIARAREDHSRSESNLGLYEERLSMIERNRAMSLKEKQEALSKLLENVNRFGEIETHLKQSELESINYDQIFKEEREKQDVERRTGANKFLAEIMGGMNNETQQRQSTPQQQPMMR